MGTARITDPQTNPFIWDYGTGKDYTTGTGLGTWEQNFDVTLSSGYHKANISSVSGDFDPLESLSWTSPNTGTGTLYGFDDPSSPTLMYYTLDSGVIPGDGQTDITGANESATLTHDSEVSANTGISPVLECYDTDASHDDEVSITGGTSSSSFFRMIRAASGEGHDGTSNNGVYFKSTTDAVIMRMQEDYTTGTCVSRIETDNTYSASICIPDLDGILSPGSIYIER